MEKSTHTNLEPNFTQTFAPTKITNDLNIFFNSTDERKLISQDGHMRDGGFKKSVDLKVFLTHSDTKCLAIRSFF